MCCLRKSTTDYQTDWILPLKAPRTPGVTEITMGSPQPSILPNHRNHTLSRSQQGSYYPSFCLLPAAAAFYNTETANSSLHSPQRCEPGSWPGELSPIPPLWQSFPASFPAPVRRLPPSHACDTPGTVSQGHPVCHLSALGTVNAWH